MSWLCPPSRVRWPRCWCERRGRRTSAARLHKGVAGSVAVEKGSSACAECGRLHCQGASQHDKKGLAMFHSIPVAAGH